MLVGHDHINNFSVTYKGINLVYSLKTGTGAYWDESLIGGTVVKINSDGVSDIYHEYVEIDHLLG